MTTDDKATAAKIVADAMNSVCETSMESAIVAALEAARDTAFAAGYAAGKVQLHDIGASVELQRHPESPYRDRIIDCTGEVPVVRRVLGTLPVSNDGFVVGLGADVWAIGNVVSKSACKLDVYRWIGPWVDTCDCGWVWYSTEGDVAPADLYSTESAAKAAMEGGTSEG